MCWDGDGWFELVLLPPSMTSAAQQHGPMLIGALLGLCLAGVITVQAYVYFTTYQKRDKLWLRLFVLFLLAFNMAHTGMELAYLYITLVRHYNNPLNLLKVTPLFALTATLTGMIAFSVQLFFAWRIKVLTNGSKSAKWLVVLVVVPAFVGLAGSIASPGQAIAVGVFSRFKERQITATVVLWLGGAATADVLIAVVLVWCLVSYEQKTGFSDELVDRVIRTTIQTGLITALWAIVDLIMYLTNTHGLHFAVNFALGKVYTSTLMSSLNARNVWSYDDSEVHVPSSGRITPGIISTSEVRLSARFTCAPPVLPEMFEREQEKFASGSSRSDVYEASICDLPSSSLPQKESDSVQV